MDNQKVIKEIVKLKLLQTQEVKLKIQKLQQKIKQMKRFYRTKQTEDCKYLWWVRRIYRFRPISLEIIIYNIILLTNNFQFSLYIFTTLITKLKLND